MTDCLKKIDMEPEDTKVKSHFLGHNIRLK